MTSRIAAFLGALALVTAAHAGPLPFAEPNLQLDVNIVSSVAALPDGSAVFGGSFTSVNGLARPGIAKLRVDGALDTAWAPSLAGVVQALQPTAGGWVYLAVNNPGRVLRIALASGEVDATWSLAVPTLSAAFLPGMPGMLVDEAADAIYVSVVNGLAKYRISTQAALPEFQVALVAPFDFGTTICGGPNAFATSIVKDGAGRLYIGGNFISVNGVARRAMARIAPDTGALDAAWDPGSAVVPAPPPLASPKLTGFCATGHDKATSLAYGNGFVYAAGFYDIGGRVSLGRFSAVTGLADPALVSPYAWNVIAGGPTVAAVIRDDQGNAYFSDASRYLPSGARDPAWSPVTTTDTGAAAPVYAMAASQGRVFVAGSFARVSGVARQGLAMLPGALSPNEDSDGDGLTNAIEAAEGLDPRVKDNDVFASSRLFVMQQYRDFLGREADPGGIAYWGDQINAGVPRPAVIESFLGSGEFQGTIAPVTRLYFAYFLRIPDYGGLTYWIGQFRGGMSLEAISDYFALSGEFAGRYGALDNAQFVDRVYQNVLGRAPDAGGRAFWTSELDSGARTRGQVMLSFSESAEYRNLIASEVYVTMAYIGMMRRAPDAGGFAYWVDYLDSGSSGLALLDGFLLSAEYHGRFLP
jgi:hypothetical protein